MGCSPKANHTNCSMDYLIRKDRSAAGEDQTTVGPEHGLASVNLTDLTPKLRRLGCHVRIQLPVTLPPWNEPEPDAAIVLGNQKDYSGRHPGAADVTCVIEVADSSLRRDRTVKLGIYAGSGIACYIIVNLSDRTVEVYTQPFNGKGRIGRYGRSITLTGRQAVELPAAGKAAERGGTKIVAVERQGSNQRAHVTMEPTTSSC
jgi:hypothetical protein